MNGKYIAGFLVTLVLAVVLFVVSINFISRSDTSVDTSNIDNPITEHVEGNSVITLYIRGQINAQETHESIRIEVTPTSKKLELISGYDGTVRQKWVYENTPEAYEEFIYALNYRGLNGVANKEDWDVRGVCPEGNTYIYNMTDDGEEVLWQWLTTCDTATTNARGMSTLFKAQIPDYEEVAGDYSL